MKTVKTVLPNEIVIFKNDDKTFHEKPSDDLACMCHPSRAIFIAKPDSGKTLCILNMILHNDFKNIIIVHNDITTKEYKLVDATIVSEIPDINDEEYFNKEIKTLLILEDLNYKNMSKEQKHRWNRMYGTWSTHNNISVWSTFQTPFSSPPEIRQMCSFIVLWRIPDYNCMTILSSRFGVNAKILKFIFENFIKSKYDFIIIDDHRPDKRIRKNLFEVININI